MCVLVGQAWKFQEPVLLVGETGCGKTTAVQVIKSRKFAGPNVPDPGFGALLAPGSESGINFLRIPDLFYYE
jgi:tRNA A37 threonylcarbamoyladenosine biosynthesis protein TsaE